MRKLWSRNRCFLFKIALELASLKSEVADDFIVPNNHRLRYLCTKMTKNYCTAFNNFIFCLSFVTWPWPSPFEVWPFCSLGLGSMRIGLPSVTISGRNKWVPLHGTTGLTSAMRNRYSLRVTGQWKWSLSFHRLCPSLRVIMCMPAGQYMSSKRLPSVSGANPSSGMS